MKGVGKIKQYLSALLWYLRRRGGSGRGAVFSVRTRGVDRRCCMAVHSVMMRLVEECLARRHRRGVYLIERAMEEVLTALRRWI
jgi:hypothetical protein